MYRKLEKKVQEGASSQKKEEPGKETKAAEVEKSKDESESKGVGENEETAAGFGLGKAPKDSKPKQAVDVAGKSGKKEKEEEESEEKVEESKAPAEGGEEEMPGSEIKTKKSELIWTGFSPGGELQYTSLTTKIDPNAPPSPFPLDSIRIVGYQDPNWDWHNWDLDREVAAAKEKAGFDVYTHDLSAFKARGGKLLLYHGWSDPGIAAGNTVNYYKGVLSKMGPKQDDWFRLFMVPGMQHCGGGPGADQFNKMGAIERWRESGIAPDQILASHVTGSTVEMTRPLCPYPKTAVYRGSGSTNDAANFSCK
jgi:hypothetical protein